LLIFFRKLLPLVLFKIFIQKCNILIQGQTKGLFGWAVAVKKVIVGCELWKNLL
jgi:hypothetical protein